MAVLIIDFLTVKEKKNKKCYTNDKFKSKNM